MMPAWKESSLYFLLKGLRRVFFDYGPFPEPGIPEIGFGDALQSIFDRGVQ